MSEEPESIPEAELVEMHFDQNGLDFRMTHPIVPIMAEHLVAAFKDSGGSNYVAFEFNTEELGPLLLTLQRRLGEHPAQKASRLEVELARLRAELAAEHAQWSADMAAIPPTTRIMIQRGWGEVQQWHTLSGRPPDDVVRWRRWPVMALPGDDILRQLPIGAA